jgi:hypothetical protein
MLLPVSDAASLSIWLIGRAMAATMFGSLVLGALHAHLRSKERHHAGFHPVRSPALAMTRPALTLLPLYGAARMATVLSALCQVSARKGFQPFDALMRESAGAQNLHPGCVLSRCSITPCHVICCAGGHGNEALAVIKWITQLLQDTSELVAICFVAWSLKRLKDCALASMQSSALRSSGDKERTQLVRLLEGASAVLNWVIAAAALLTALSAYGVDVRPMLASLGASSVIIGLAAQSLLANVAAGVSLYAGRPFIVGDHIQLLSLGGGVVAKGTVQAIALSRTMLRDEEGALIYVNNADARRCSSRTTVRRSCLLQFEPHEVTYALIRVCKRSRLLCGRTRRRPPGRAEPLGNHTHRPPLAEDSAAESAVSESLLHSGSTPARRQLPVQSPPPCIGIHP